MNRIVIVEVGLGCINSRVHSAAHLDTLCTINKLLTHFQDTPLIYTIWDTYPPSPRYILLLWFYLKIPVLHTSKRRREGKRFEAVNLFSITAGMVGSLPIPPPPRPPPKIILRLFIPFSISIFFFTPRCAISPPPLPHTPLPPPHHTPLPFLFYPLRLSSTISYPRVIYLVLHAARPRRQVSRSAGRLWQIKYYRPRPPPRLPWKVRGGEWPNNKNWKSYRGSNIGLRNLNFLGLFCACMTLYTKLMEVLHRVRIQGNNTTTIL